MPSAYNAVQTARDGLVKAENQQPQKGSSGSTSANASNAYGAAGVSVVTAAQNVATPASVRSDTTVDFTLLHGQAYCFKMTVVNGNGMAPSFTVGNGSVLKTQFLTQIGNDYYYRVLGDRHAGPEHGRLYDPAGPERCEALHRDDWLSAFVDGRYASIAR